MKNTMRKWMVLSGILLLAVMAAAQANPPVPAGTALMVKLDTTLATFSNRPGDPFRGQLSQPVMLSGKIMIPAGATVEGRVTKVSEPRRISGKPSITILPEAVIFPNGERYFLDATLVDTNLGRGSDVDTEGRFKGSGFDKSDKIETGAGTAGGMLIGGLGWRSSRSGDGRSCGCHRDYRALAREASLRHFAGWDRADAGVESSANGFGRGKCTGERGTVGRQAAITGCGGQGVRFSGLKARYEWALRGAEGRSST